MDIKNLYDMKNNRKILLDAATEALSKKDMETYKAKMADVQKLNAEIEAGELLLAEEGRFADNDPHMVTLHDVTKNQKNEDAQMRAIDAARSGREYATAFANAIKNGERVRRKSGVFDESLSPLYNALTIGGGTPEGADGGFLVPIEFDNMIHTIMKDYVRLADYFNVENVSGLTGWRAVEASSVRKPLPEINEMGTIDPDDQPSYDKVTYTIRKFGDRLPISGELMQDNTAGLLKYLASWFGPKVVLTENSLLLALLDSLTATALPKGKEVSGIKSAFNKELNTAVSRNSIMLANQSSYDFLDNLTDTQGRGLLVPNVSDPDTYRFKGKPVVFGDDDIIPNDKISGAYPLYLGCFKAFGTLFRRQAMEFAATDIGGKAWETASTEIRAIVRMDAQKVDEKAVVKKTIAAPGA